MRCVFAEHFVYWCANECTRGNRTKSNHEKRITKKQERESAWRIMSVKEKSKEKQNKLKQAKRKEIRNYAACTAVAMPYFILFCNSLQGQHQLIFKFIFLCNAREKQKTKQSKIDAHAEVLDTGIVFERALKAKSKRVLMNIPNYCSFPLINNRPL